MYTTCSSAPNGLSNAVQVVVDGFRHCLEGVRRIQCNRIVDKYCLTAMSTSDCSMRKTTQTIAHPAMFILGKPNSFRLAKSLHFALHASCVPAKRRWRKHFSNSA